MSRQIITVPVRTVKFSIRTRLTLLYIATMVFVIVAFFIFVYTNFSYAIFSSDINTRFDDKLIQYGRDVADALSRRHGPFYSSIDEFSRDFEKMVYYDFFLRASCGQVRDFPSRPGDAPIILIRNNALGKGFIPLTAYAHQALERGEPVVETLHDVMPYALRVVSLKYRDPDRQNYVLQVGMSMEYINTTLRTVVLRFVLMGPLLLVIISVAGYLFVRRSFTPVKEIVRLTRRITAEDLSLRIRPSPGNDEVSALAETLNGMIERLDRSFRQVKQFSDDVSHELRTPLTVLKGEIEVALRHDRGADQYRLALESVRQEVGKLELIVENLLFLSRMDAGRAAAEFSDVELDKVLLEAFEDVLSLAVEKEVTIEIGELEEASMKGDPGLLKRLFFNLMANAVRYTPAGGWVRAALVREPGAEGGIRCSVSDNGVGIPSDAIPRIFDRFYRVDASRSPVTGGAGLGLTIVKKILDLHRGTVRVESAPGRGTVFYVFFMNINKF